MKRKELDTPSASAAGAPQEDEAEEVSDEQRDTKRVLPGQSVLEDIGEGTVKIGKGRASAVRSRVVLCMSCLYALQALD